jgi:hypothetical protein
VVAYLKIKDFHSATKFVYEGLGAFPRFTRFGELHLRILRISKDPKYTLEKIQEYQRRFPEYESFEREEGIWYMQHYQYEQAISHFKKMLVSESGDTRIKAHLLSAYVKSNQIDNARTIADDLLKEKNFVPKAGFFNNLSRILPEKLEDYDRILKSIPGHKTEISWTFMSKYLRILESNTTIEKTLEFVNSSISSQKFSGRITRALVFEKARLNAEVELRSNHQHRSKSSLSDKLLQDMPEYKTENSALINSFIDQWESIGSHQSKEYLNTYFVPQATLNIALDIIESIQKVRPYSLVRLGDGEGRFLPYPEAYKEHEDPDRKVMIESWWGLKEIPLSIQELITSFKSAVTHADIVGIPEHHRLFGMFDIYEPVPETLNIQLRGLKGSIDFASELSRSGKNQIFTSANIHHDLELWGLYDLIFSYLNTCSIISCHAELSAYVKNRFGVHVRELYRIPPAYRFSETFNQEAIDEVHYPEIFHQTLEKLEVDQPGEVFLVSAGFLGKIYCARIKELGGIALDIGSRADYWLDYETRLVSDLTNLQKPKLAHFYDLLASKGIPDLYTVQAQQLERIRGKYRNVERWKQIHLLSHRNNPTLIHGI